VYVFSPVKIGEYEDLADASATEHPAETERRHCVKARRRSGDRSGIRCASPTGVAVRLCGPGDEF
jgi:hypothetical protein